MADLSAHEAPPVVLDRDAAEQLTTAQLHGEACWRDPSCAGPYTPAGHAFTQPSEPGAPLGWVVAACPLHAGRPA